LLLLLAGSTGSVQAQSAEDLHVARRSAFESPADARDPLTPIGWQKGPVVLAANGGQARTVESYILPAAFVVSSISLDRIPLAVINGKAYGEGDAMPFNAGGEKIQIQIFAIRDGTVTLRYKALQLTCPIRASQSPKSALPAK
jgi:hypothetical protein